MGDAGPSASSSGSGRREDQNRMASSVPMSVDDGSAYLVQASKTVKRAGFYMRQAMDNERPNDGLEDALRHSAVMLGELRTSALGPQKYYELYMAVLNELHGLEGYFKDCVEACEEDEQPRKVVELYQKVQHAGNVVPRLYLLCTVGACAIAFNSEDGEKLPVFLMMKDMEDMCKGVQHPIRGLFLRAYLVQTCRGLLSSSVRDDVNAMPKIRFLLENFIEMNKLWVRMKRQGGAKGLPAQNMEASAIEKERAQLADLVGKNLTQLSQLECLSFDVYRDMVLPKILDQVVSCKDTLAQGYLMECITAVFPDEFQIGTIDQLLSVLPKLEPGVFLASVLGSMLDRLAQYSHKSSEVIENLDEINAFGKIGTAIETSVMAHMGKGSMSGELVASMYGGLLSFAQAVYPDRLVYIDDILHKSATVLESEKDSFVNDGKTEKKIIALLSIPLEQYDLKTVLTLEHFGDLLGVLSQQRQIEVAGKIAGMVPVRGEVIEDLTSASALFAILCRLLHEGEDADDNARVFAKSLHCFKLYNSIEDHFALLSRVFDYINEMGSTRDVLRRAVGPAILCSSLTALRFSNNLSNSMIEPSRLLFCIKVCNGVADAGAPAMAIQLLLETGIVTANVTVPSKDKILYECFEQSFILFEDNIHDSKECLSSLYGMMNAMYAVGQMIGDETWATLTLKINSYCSRLLRRKDQCSAVLAYSRIHWNPNGRTDGASVISSLQRAERIVNALKEQNALMERTTTQKLVPGYLSVEILDNCIYYHNKGVPEVTKVMIDEVSRRVMREVEEYNDNTLETYLKQTMTSLNHQ